jgi:hypothetical protein
MLVALSILALAGPQITTSDHIELLLSVGDAAPGFPTGSIVQDF